MTFDVTKQLFRKKKLPAQCLAVGLSITAISISSLPISTNVHAAQPNAYELNIKQGDLASQLNHLAAATHIYLAADGSLLRGKQGKPIQGVYTPQAALDALLHDSGLAAIRNADGSYTLMKEQVLIPSSATTWQMENITVTGEKVNRSLSETVSSVSVITGDQLQENHYKEVNEVIERVPNVIQHPFGVPNIRGVDGAGAAQGVFSFISGGRPRVSTSVDGLSESWTGVRYINTGLWDTKQVEVLRGPQSTSQGRNTLGGAIVVTTNDPDYEWQGKVRTGYENQDGKYQIAAVISGPLIEDELAVRIAAERLSGDSFINYHLSESEWPKDPNESTSQSIRAKLLWEPLAIPELSAKLTLTQRNADGEYLNYINGPDFSDYNFDGDNNNTRLQNSEETGLSLDIQYLLNDDLTAHLLLGHQRYQSEFTQYPSLFYMDLEENSTTFESRLTYEPAEGLLSGVVGLYYYTKNEDILIYDGGFDGTDKITTVALFGETTLSLSDKLDLIAGGRLEREHQTRDIVAWPGTAWQGEVDLDHAKNIFLPKIGLAYHLSANSTLSLTARRGYNAGGGALDWDDSEFYTFDEERVTTYEAGIRSALLDNRLNLSASVFYNQFDGYLAYVAPRFTNLSKAESYGLELEANAQPTPSLRVFGSLGWLNSKITDTKSGYESLQGNEFGYAPNLTANLGFDHDIHAKWSWGANAHFVDGYYSDASNTEETEVDGYTTVNLHTAYKINPDLTLSGYVNNLTNEEVIYRVTTNGQANVGAPRTLGVTLDYQF